MPNTESAKKRIRQTKKRNAVNQWRKRRIKDGIKTFQHAMTAGDVNAAETAFRDIAGVLDRIACTSTIHKNTAGRRKSRMAKRLNALKGAATGEKSATAASGAKKTTKKA